MGGVFLRPSPSQPIATTEISQEVATEHEEHEEPEDPQRTYPKRDRRQRVQFQAAKTWKSCR